MRELAPLNPQASGCNLLIRTQVIFFPGTESPPQWHWSYISRDCQNWRDLAGETNMKMAELQFEAPLAKFDGDEWNEFHDFQTTSDMENSNKDSCTDSKKNDASDADNFSETFSCSLEDLVNTFDEKITKCFCDYEESVEKLAPVQIRTQEEIMSDCE